MILTLTLTLNSYTSSWLKNKLCRKCTDAPHMTSVKWASLGWWDPICVS